jgi:hypothetical protein
MNKERIRYWLDFIPVIILLVNSVRLIYTLSTTAINIEWNNITGLLVLPVLLYLLFKKHKAGVLLTGLVLLLAVFGLFSYTEGLRVWTFGLKLSDSKATIQSHGDLKYLLYFILHLLLSGRYYVGILTREYWGKLAN